MKKHVKEIRVNEVKNPESRVLLTDAASIALSGATFEVLDPTRGTQKYWNSIAGGVNPYQFSAVCVVDLACSVQP